MERRSNIFRMTAVPILGIVVSILAAACASSRFDSFERDPAFLYGSGTGATSPAAVEAARADLAAVGLARSLGGDVKALQVTDDMSKSVRLPAMKSFIESTGTPVLYIEDEYSTSSLGRVRTRIEAFLEMIA